jgi:CHAT domain/Tetratricopeptide repeat
MQKLLNFDVAIEPRNGGYRTRVLDSPAGQAHTDFVLPFTDPDLENFVLKVGMSIGRIRRKARRIESPERQLLEVFGGQLFGATFSGAVRSCLDQSLAVAESKGCGLRIRLRLPAALANIPWEYLYDGEYGFVSLSPETALVRYMEMPRSVRPFPISPPLRILAMISAPIDVEGLSGEEEWAKLNSALGDLVGRGLVEADRLEAGTLSALQRPLRLREYHVLHFVGHGYYDEDAQDGALALEGADGRTRLVSGRDLGLMIRGYRSLRLVVLNACEGARYARDDPLGGVAQALVRQGIPAVIAMQFEISDPAAVVLSQSFYQAIADGLPVDIAMVEARRAMFADGHEVEWATPVLYLRSPDGRIFTRSRIPEADRKAQQEADRRAEQEADRQAQQRAQQEADRQAQQRAQQEADRQAQQKADLPLLERQAGSIGQRGDAAGARDQYAILLPIRERVSGPEHPRTLTVRANLAYWTGQAGDAAAARDQYATLLPIRERVSGPEHPDTLAARANLAYWTGRAGDPAAARNQYAKLLPVCKRVLSLQHPDTLAARANLARWTGQAGDPAAARNQHATLLPEFRQVLGPEHPETLAVCANLARWTGQAGDAAGARDQYATLLPIRERISGPGHPDTLAVRASLARWTGRAGDAAGARDQYATLLPEFRQALGPEHPETLAIFGNFAYWTGQAGDAAGARDQYATLLFVRERVTGPEHPDTLAARASLARWTGQAGDASKARDQYAKLLPVLKRVLGPKHRDTTTVRKQLAYWTRRAGK